MQRTSLIDALAAEGLLDATEAGAVVAAKSDSKKPVSQSLVDAGLLSEVDLAMFLARFCGLPFVSVAGREIEPEVLALLPGDVAESCCVVPLSRENGTLTLAVADPFDVSALDVVQARVGGAVRLVVSTRTQILDAVRGRSGDIHREVGGLVERLSPEDIEFLATEVDEDDGPLRHDAPLIQMVNTLIVDAIHMKASDIHVEPQESSLRIRYRIDGVLRNMCELPRSLQSAVLSRLKLTSGMDIAEKRRSQDGRARIKVGQRVVDLRVSSMCSYHGEKIVMRILDRAVSLPTLDELGFLPGDRARYEDLLQHAQGILLITGPTGSGKTTTLYASLSALNGVGENVVTVEDPIEYQLNGITQIQVNPKVGVVFESAMRSILRQDPDIIMIGEIRDVETAEVAIQAAQTGHLVFSTLHTNSAAASLTRLAQMGVAPYMTASALLGVTAQRLVRSLCPHCKEETTPSPSLLHHLAAATDLPVPSTFLEGRGCDHCAFTGMQGRIGLFEILVVTEPIKELVFSGASQQELERAARADGMHTLLEDGLLKVGSGLTSLAEVLRIVSVARRGAGVLC